MFQLVGLTINPVEVLSFKLVRIAKRVGDGLVAVPALWGNLACLDGLGDGAAGLFVMGTIPKLALPEIGPEFPEAMTQVFRVERLKTKLADSR